MVVTINTLSQDLIRAKIVDFLVFGCSFSISYSFLSLPNGGDFFLHTFMYTSVIFLSVWLGKLFLESALRSMNGVVKHLLCNATGLLAGACVMLLIGSYIPEFAVPAIAIIFASVIAFFVLGTLSPLLSKSNQIPH